MEEKTNFLNLIKYSDNSTPGSFIADYAANMETIDEFASSYSINAVKKYTATIGDGNNTTFIITHNLNTRDVVITIRETDYPYTQISTSTEFTSPDTLTLNFTSAPAENQYTVIVIG